MVSNDAGRMVAGEWMKSADIRNEIELDAFVVMPNHVHGIIAIHAVGVIHVGVIHELPLRNDTKHRRTMLIPKIVGYVKMNTAKRINDMRNIPGAKLWQRNYYEHVIRDEDDLNRIRQYILDNPARWAKDENNPDHLGRLVEVEIKHAGPWSLQGRIGD